MTREDIIRKLTSRMFWVAVAAFIAGLIVAFGETAETAEGSVKSYAQIYLQTLAE